MSRDEYWNDALRVLVNYVNNSGRFTGDFDLQQQVPLVDVGQMYHQQLFGLSFQYLRDVYAPWVLSFASFNFQLFQSQLPLFNDHPLFHNNYVGVRSFETNHPEKADKSYVMIFFLLCKNPAISVDFPLFVKTINRKYFNDFVKYKNWDLWPVPGDSGIGRLRRTGNVENHRPRRPRTLPLPAIPEIDDHDAQVDNYSKNADNAHEIMNIMGDLFGCNGDDLYGGTDPFFVPAQYVFAQAPLNDFEPENIPAEPPLKAYEEPEEEATDQEIVDRWTQSFEQEQTIDDILLCLSENKREVFMNFCLHYCIDNRMLRLLSAETLFALNMPLLVIYELQSLRFVC